MTNNNIIYLIKLFILSIIFSVLLDGSFVSSYVYKLNTLQDKQTNAIIIKQNGNDPDKQQPQIINNVEIKHTKHNIKSK